MPSMIPVLEDKYNVEENLEELAENEQQIMMTQQQVRIQKKDIFCKFDFWPLRLIMVYNNMDTSITYFQMDPFDSK